MALFFKRQRQGAAEEAAAKSRGTELGRVPRSAVPPQPMPSEQAAGTLLRPALAAGAAPSAAAAPTAQGSAKARYGYPLKLTLPLRVAAFLLIGLAFFNLLQSVLAVLGKSTAVTAPIVTLIGAAAGLLFSFFAALLLADALPSFEVRPEGLAISSLLRWRVLPWQRVARLSSMELGNDRYLVFLAYSGRPLALTHPVYSLLAGMDGRAGVFYTAAIKNFDELTRLVLAGRMRAMPGAAVDELLDETANMPLISILQAPDRAINRLAGVADEDDDQPLLAVAGMHRMERRHAISTQLWLAALPLMLFWVDRLVRGLVPPVSDGWPLLWGSLALLLIGMAELFVLALATQAIGESVVGRGEFDLTLAVYPYLELVRVLGLGVAFALLAVKAPFVLPLIFWLAGAALVASLSALFAQRLYGLNRNQALLAGAASAAIQSLVIILYAILRG